MAASWTGSIAASMGAPEAALKLVLGQLAGYPLLLLYRRHLADKDSNLQHLYFFLSGLLLAHWVIGEGVTHSLYTILSTYLVLLVSGGTATSVLLSLVLNMGYLLTGYWYMSGDEYDVSWTMPQCVLCLRLIGLTWDVYDGERQRLNPGSLSPDQARTALSSSPNILEMLSHSFFIGGYFVGPQFSMAKFRQVVSPSYQASLPSPGPVRFGLTRLALSMVYMVFHLVGSSFLPDLWPTTQDFFDRSILTRLLLMPFWCKFILAKYLFMWLMAEGVCAISGLSYLEHSEDKDKAEPDWKGCANVKLRRLESATKFGHYVEAFNINTNQWVMKYVYKRLRFLNNKDISQGATLVFLAVWHGWHSGYYVTFFNEFIVIKFEKEWAGLWARSPKVARWKEHPAYDTVTFILRWMYVFFFLPQCFLAFPLLHVNRYWPVIMGTFFLEYIFFIGWLGWGRLAKSWLLNESKGVATKEIKDKHAEETDKTTEEEGEKTGSIGRVAEGSNKVVEESNKAE